MTIYIRHGFVPALLWLIATGGVAAEPAASIDFNRDVRSILSNKCFTCHGPDDAERQASLRLDTQVGMTSPADSGEIAVVAGDPSASELVKRITSSDDGLRMPPSESGKTLSAKEVQLLTDWIKQGAEFSTHWSYVKPVRPQLPALASHQDWVRSPIDHFVLARLLREGLAPSAEADRHALIRRVSLDLTGLPPTIEEVDAFVHDQAPQAYERLVDRLLEQKSHGEHWARKWLDLARYADSAGYADDPPRTIWGYRDYVIRSLNDNKPFDQFTIEQIAGDLLPEPTLEQLVATAFHRNTLTNNEGGTNDEEFRNVAVVDRVNTTMAVWMGTTIDCAQCHNHKYDPISQEEYFRFFAFFNNTEDADLRDESPRVEVWTAEQERRKEAWQSEIERLQTELAADTPELREAQALWEAKIASDEGSAVTGSFVRVEIVDREEFLSLAEVQVLHGEENVAPRGKATQSSVDYDGPPELAIDGNTDGDYNAKSTTHTKKERNPWWQVELAEPVAVERIIVWNRTDGNVGGRLNGFRVSILDAQQQPVWQQQIKEAPSPHREFTVAGVPAKILAIAKRSAEERTDKQQQTLRDYYRSISPELKPIRQQLGALQKQLADMKPTTIPIMRELAAEQRRVTKIQRRGNFMDTGAGVTAGAPAAFHPLSSVGMTGIETDSLPNRLDLAHWLVADDNPLTARVIANRYWEAIFGVGIVSSSEEFGSQGDLPSHPELLDWLATELVRLQWDMKAFVKLLVTSATYRQSSAVTAELFERDPDNRLLARGPRFRLSAETIRDQALFVSGLLSDKMYGPPVKPPQPSIGLNAAFGSGIDWQTSEGDDRYRRGLYTTWRRSNPYPSMAAFDAPNREICTVRRDRTNTPLQALVTLNDPVYIEAAQSLARRIHAAARTPAERAAIGFRVCVARPPREDELARLLALYEKARESLSQDLVKAEQLATNPLGPLPAGSDAAELAAWTIVGNVLLNLDEMFLKR